uniref:Retrovirus-related Pol polyprotein from transposon TNT 1-94 n=1 Tax=Cajanus cajan TaxID=3821 RepID=A0A151UB69_CAJCA|nr:Retrovirus-related Pol polyprotein from transposon TNT 1-94 [Cajanus cajan]
MYSHTCTRLDISFVIEMLGQFQSNLGINHWKVAKKDFRHLQGTKYYMLTYRRLDYLEVVDYLDLDYTRCIGLRKSSFEYIFLLVGGAISWKSVKQSMIATSTMEAKFVAFEPTIQALWSQKFTLGFGIINNKARSSKIYCDNSTIFFFYMNDNT